MDEFKAIACCHCLPPLAPWFWPLLITHHALIRKYVVKGLPYAVAPSTFVGRVLGPLGRLEIFGSGCCGHRTGLARGCGAAGRGLLLWAEPCRLGEEELRLGELITPLCERMAL